ncbi:glycoside hydrolase family 3 N-terminal domain-containing protein [Methylomonas koyamae]|uniref:glycoside hydrolase family 3 N-terminal domain-containing protein n=1 Tax=Methylomonas koyamae TaxID=702114 RepID=UPI001C33046C|nr:glycoside hydrolase family 3 N-terminal domain-containing protein [Methylomonas koyamae]BBL58684.1 glycosyl hydrolase [Methylomonas koyamae]
MSAQESNEAVENQVRALLAQMTLEEKIGQMTQIDFSVISVADGQDAENPIDPAKLEEALLQYHVGSILNAPSTPNNKAQPIGKWRRLTQQIRDAAARTRLKIPVIYGIDAIHGATYTQNAVLFPQAISMAATFNPELSFREGEITAREVKASGLDWNFAPVMDIGRQPLWPRLWETYGEDVHLASAMGSAYIRGHQGDDIAAADKAPTCLKHYVGYSYPLNGKDRTPAWIGERALREWFLPPFEAGVLAGAPTVMVNSAEVDGVPGHANRHYLNDILRGEMGFDGFTVSDWEDIIRLYSRDKLADSPREAIKIAVMAGVDMSMVPFDYSFYYLLLDLAQSGEVPLARIDEAVTRILRVKYRSGLFERREPALPEAGYFATAEAAAVNRQAAREAIVLAKNDHRLLPLSKRASVLVTGPAANLLSVMNGGWTITWQGNKEEFYPQDKPTLLDAIRQKTEGKVTYVGGKQFSDEINIEQAVSEARHHDIVVLALGEKTYTETEGNIDSLQLDPVQLQLARAIFQTGKPVVLVTFGGRPRIITEIANQAQAVVLGFLPGMEGGAAMADILFGDVNPSGKLPISYPRDSNDITPYDHKPIEAYESNQYRPLYPFGHGLSYTTFETNGLRLAQPAIKTGDNLQLSVNVKNTGNLAGKETVMVYLHDVAASVTRPVKQLKAFKKVELQPGEQRTLEFELTPRDLSFIGLEMKRVVEPGEFIVTVGSETASFHVLN